MPRTPPLPLAAPLLGAALLLGPLFLACKGTPAAPPRPPDMLLLVIDCLRGDGLSTHGYARPTTPHLDALAREGVDFVRAFAPSSWTRPSLPSLLTGLYPSEHGLIDLAEDAEAPSAALAEPVETMAERLRAQGYATAMFGNQHQLSVRFGLQQGFDVWQPKSGDAANLHRRFLEWQQGLGAGRADGGKRGGERRFFAYLHYLELHWPYCPPHDVRGRFDPRTSTLNPCSDWRGLRDRIRTGEVVLSPADLDLLRSRYDEELLAVDAEIGKLLAELRRRGAYDETLVVVTADHGEEFGEHGGVFHGTSLYDELLHVPLIVKPPKSWRAEVGRRVEGLAETRSLAATFLDAGGSRPADPAGGRPAAQGAVSLLPWIRGDGDAAGPSAHIVAEMQDRVAVRTAQWKLVAWKTERRLELYDLAADPGEKQDVAAQRRREVGTLRQLLLAWREGLRPAQRHDVQMDEETRKGLENLGYL